MDTTVGALKVGAQLVMGKYGVDKDNPYPIVWLKGNPRTLTRLSNSEKLACFSSSHSQLKMSLRTKNCLNY